MGDLIFVDLVLVGYDYMGAVYCVFELYEHGYTLSYC